MKAKGQADTNGRAAKRDPLRIHGTIARDIGISIVSGRIPPGEVLDGEVAASGQLQVSRTAYREAVRILAAKGLVESRPKRGTTVSERKHWHLLDPDVLAWIFQNEPEPFLMANLFELRRIVEPEAARLAAERRTPAHLEQMATALEVMAEHTLAAETGRDADQLFHSALLDASGNAFLSTLTSGVGAAVAWTTIFKQRKSPLRRDPIPDHVKVYEAVAAGDAQGAHRAMTELVDWAFIDTTSAEGGSSDQSEVEMAKAVRKAVSPGPSATKIGRRTAAVPTS
jgi:DNA-binding FadR family transcriptional regulator